MSDHAPVLNRPAPYVAEVRLRRPDKANRLTPNDLDALARHFEAIERDETVRVVVLAAEGSVFCAGFDLTALTAQGRSERARAGEGTFETVANQLAGLRPVTIAALNGPVIGGGTDLALAADLRIGVATVTLQMPAAKIGVPLYASALERYVQRFGPDLAKQLIFLAKTIDAGELTASGFLAEVVADPAALARRSMELAESLAALSPRPLAAMKRVLNAVARGERVSDDLRGGLHSAFDPAEIAARVAAEREKRRNPA